MLYLRKALLRFKAKTDADMAPYFSACIQDDLQYVIEYGGVTYVERWHYKYSVYNDQIFMIWQYLLGMRMINMKVIMFANKLSTIKASHQL